MRLIPGHVGSRKVRSAGKKSGSVELTLPSVFAALEGVPCDISVKSAEGNPVIELRPRGAPLENLLDGAWSAMQRGLYGEDGRDLPADLVTLDFGTGGDDSPEGVVFSAGDLRLLRQGAEERGERALAACIEGLVTLDQLVRDQNPDRARMSGKIIACLLTGDSLDLDFYAIDAMRAMARKAAFEARFQAACLADSRRWAEVGSAYRAITGIVGAGAFDERARSRRAFDLAMRFEKSVAMGGHTQFQD